MASLSSDIRIVGYASRLPGANTTEEFWELLRSGTCSVTSVDPQRWPLSRFRHPDTAMPGRSYTWAAGQIDDVWGFDPAFFGISPREALQMDPQQRLLLQLVWESLEHANIRPSDIAGSSTGVYVGASSLDYHHRFLTDPANADMQFMTGNTLSIVSNRISYIYDLRGPSFTVDTACSSSLVALHEAVSALESGRIDTAIVCGISLLLSPFPFIGFSRATMLSPTGLCQAFDANGDGYVRSEGGVVMVLQSERAKKLPGTMAHARLVACGLNADGRTVGMSLPSSEAQGNLLQEIYGGQLNVNPNDLAFIEAHGTGTRVGDPAEAQALGTSVSQKRDDKLLIGSVKTNVGHLEPASGLVGVLKSILALKHDLLPKSLHFKEPNPDIPFDELNLEVAAEATPLAPSDKPRLAGINSFGFGGTNAHAVISDGDPVAASSSASTSSKPSVLAPLLLSARSKASLAELAQTYKDRLTNAPQLAKDLVLSTAQRRDLLSERLIVLGESLEDKLQALDAFIKDESDDRIVTGSAQKPKVPIGFVFSGNGAQWAGMGQEAYKQDRGFQESFEKVDHIFMGVGGWSLLTTLFSDDLEAEIERTEIAQPLLFAIQVAVTESLKMRGIEPNAVIGHSVGEVAAAWASGALTLPQAVKVIHARSTEQEVVRDLGSMAALLLPAEKAREALAASGLPRLELAAINSPRSVTISGDVDSLDAFAKFARKNKWAMRRLNLAYPFHSALVDPIREPLLKALSEVTPGKHVLPFFSTVTPDETAPLLDADYWWRNVRQPVLFSEAANRMAQSGIGVFVEIGPKPVLSTYVNDVLRAEGARATVIGSLDQPPKSKAPVSMADAKARTPLDRVAASILAAGGETELSAFVGDAPDVAIALPQYPWQNTEIRPEATDEDVDFIFGVDIPLLGYRMRPEAAEWFNTLDAQAHPWLADHKVEDTVVFPAAGFAEMALKAALQWSGHDQIELRDFDILRPLVFEDGDSFETLVRLSPDDHVVEVLSRPRLKDSEFALNARGHYVSVSSATGTPRLQSSQAVQAKLDKDELYRITQTFGLNYGPIFRRAESVTASSQTEAELTLSPRDAAIASLPFAFCPSLLDSGFHGLFALLSQLPDLPKKTSFLPIRIGALRLLQPGVDPVKTLIKVTKASPRSLEANFEFIDTDGLVVARLEKTRFRAVTLGKIEHTDELIYRQTAVLLPDRSRQLAKTLLPGGSLDAFGQQAEFASETAPDLSDSVLLIEALGRTVAHTGMFQVAGGTPFTIPDLVADGHLYENAQPLFEGLLDWLLESGLADIHDQEGDTASWILTDPADGPSVDLLMQTVYREAGNRIATASLLARLSQELPNLLENGLPATAQGYYANSLFAAHTEGSGANQALDSGLKKAVLALLAEAPKDRSLRIALIGAQSGGLALALDRALDPVTQELVISDAMNSNVARAERLWTGSRSTRHVPLADLADDTGGFDLVIGAGPAGNLNREQLALLKDIAIVGAQWLTAEPLPSPLENLIQGIGADWWAVVDEEDDENTDRDWASVLEGLGLTEIETRALETSEGEIDVSSARTKSFEPAVADNENTAPVDQSETKAPIVVLADREGTSRKLAEGLHSCLEKRGYPVQIAVPAAEGEPDIGHLAIDMNGSLSELTDVSAKGGQIIFLLGAYGNPSDALALSNDRLWALTRVLNAHGGDEGQITFIAPNAARDMATAAMPAPEQSALWGYARVAMNEFPQIKMKLIDLAPDLAPGLAAARLAQELASDDNEREIVLDGDRRYGLRVLQGGLLDETHLPDGSLPSVRLDVIQQGSLDQLAWTPIARPELKAGDVEIEVKASGLNFRDVMWALGLLPEEALEDGFAGPTLGMECCGTVVRVGPDVSRFQPGDQVITFAPACFSAHVMVDESGCAPMPTTVSPEEAATIPVTFLTAYYALVKLASLEEGETILIHGGAGGVGLAALQIAKWRGAKVIATAGSPEKRAFLTLLGADVVLDSRTLEFVDAVMDETAGEGVDVVLNSLFGEAMERSIEVLKPFGRFLELGKRDYYGNTRIGLRPFRQNLTYFGIDADQLLTRQPKLAKRLFKELVELFEDGTLAPLPYRAFEADQVVEAFRLMQQAGHIGKIVLRPPQIPEIKPEPAPLAMKPDATYVVAGGFGGFGAELLKRLAMHGAAHLAVLSRRGGASEDAQAVIGELEAMGVQVSAHACDITDESAVASALQTIRQDQPAIAGVFHTAMVLKDVLIANLDQDALNRVIAPKVRGAELLDRLTRQDSLDHFVVYSSATTLVGNPGQANYVAANAYLEALARKRRTEGLAGLAVAWGAISDAGYLARNTEVGDLLARKLGKHSLAASEALDGLVDLMRQPQDDVATAALGFARIDWAAASRDLALIGTPLFALMGVGAGDDGQGSEGAVDLHVLLKGMTKVEASQTVGKLLAAEIGKILRISGDDIDAHKPLSEIGMDSLMALELRMSAERQLGIDIPLMSLANGATLNDLSGRIASRVLGESGDEGISGETQRLASSHIDGAGENMSDLAELEQRMNDKSRELGSFL
ncbi:SDR family NAD(P)-dependent oxidoreductase [Roseibium limicola]|uniref:SDR family NAD(P)-dependent oxidoreductase n=1 Tax=Roseibium limicola TaxID=2816037 RepID=UPI001AD8F883